jgi:hypothetical protein
MSQHVQVLSVTFSPVEKWVQIRCLGHKRVVVLLARLFFRV